MTAPIVQTVKDALAGFLATTSDQLRIEAVYGVGGIARGSKVIRDVDLNIFTHHCSGRDTLLLERMVSHIADATSRPVDVNIIDMVMVERNFIGSPWFVHTGRHVLFLHEIQQVKCLLYGDDMVANVHLDYSDLLTEALKLTFTQGHRLEKEYFSTEDNGSIYAKRRYAKYLRYAVEFAMVFSGSLNPYIGLTGDDIVRVYPDIYDYRSSCHSAITSADCGLSFVEAMDAIFSLSHIMMQRFYHLLESRGESSHIKVGAPLNEEAKSGEIYFNFPDEASFTQFFRNYDSLPAYRRLR